MTLSQTHTHIHTHNFVLQDVSVILAPPVFSACSCFMTNSFCLPAPSFHLPPPHLFFSLFPLPVVMLFLSLSVPLPFFYSAHLTPYFFLICPPFPPANPFTPSPPSDHPSPHYLSGCSPLLPLACSPTPFCTFFSYHRPSVGFFTIFFHLYFYRIPRCLCIDPLSPFTFSF